MSLISTAEAKTFLQVSHSDDDTLIARLVTNVDADVMKITGKLFSGTTTVEDQVDGGHEHLVLSTPPVDTGQSFVVTDQHDDDAVIVATDYDLDDVNAVVYVSVDAAVDKWPSGRRRYKIAYTGGYSAVPEAIKGIVMQLVAAQYNRRDPGAISESEGEHKVASEAGIPKDIREKLELWKDGGSF